MSFCCRTCDHRNHAVKTASAPASQLDVCLITLTFKAAVSQHSKSYAALNTTLNNIIDSEQTSSHPTTFTSWSPCLTHPNTVVIISTALETCSSASSPVFTSVSHHLAQPPNIRHVYLDYSIVSLAASSPDQRVPVDIIQLCAPNSGVAAAIGKQFGWDPKRSSLQLQMASQGGAGFSRPGDLVKDFWAWAELRDEDGLDEGVVVGSPQTQTTATTIGSSFSSSHESLMAIKSPPLRSHNSDERDAVDQLLWGDGGGDDDCAPTVDEETLIAIFTWSSHADAERFKHPLQASFGSNGQEIRKDLWDAQVAHPVRQLQGMGAKLDTFKLELRAMEPRISKRSEAEEGATRKRSGSKRLSVIASGLSEKVSGLWR